MTRPVTRRRLRSRAALVGGLAVAAAALAAPVHAAPSVAEISLTAPTSVEVGAEVTVTVATTGAVDLYAYDLAVAYDPELVRLVDGSVVTPDGGFADATDDAAGRVAVTHTRLGTSPGLEGDVTLATLTFTAVSEGAAAFAVPAATLVGADAETTTLTDAASATTTVAAVVDPPTGEPTQGVTTPPVDDGTTSPGDDGASDSSSSSAGSAPGGALASTGASVAWFVGAALLAVAVGTGILLARRRAVTR